MSADQPLLVRTPDAANAPLIPVKPPPALETLARVLDRLEALPCLS
jgi:hypothetical protein